jgi:hypothetical protein
MPTAEDFRVTLRARMQGAGIGRRPYLGVGIGAGQLDPGLTLIPFEPERCGSPFLFDRPRTPARFAADSTLEEDGFEPSTFYPESSVSAAFRASVAANLHPYPAPLCTPSSRQSYNL